MRKTVNLTQHPATKEQIAAGVFDLTGDELTDLKALLTFGSAPVPKQVQGRAVCLATLAAASDGTYAMIGGAPYLMGPLEAALIKEGVIPRYSFSQRESVEATDSDGTVKKTAVFKHRGWVDVTLGAV